MHELSIVAALVEQVEAALADHPDAVVTTVGLRIGRLRLVEPVTLEFCYQTTVAGTPLDGSQLAITFVEARAHCPACDREFAVEEQWFECPHCGAAGGELRRGNELLLERIELAHAPVVLA